MDTPTFGLKNTLPIEIVLRRHQPICITEYGLATYKRQCIHILSFKDWSTLATYHIAKPITGYLESVPLYFRALRCGVRCGISMGNEIVFVCKKKILSLDILRGKIHNELTLDRGFGPLRICFISGIKGFRHTYYFGEYFSNHKKKPVYIYQRTKSKKWKPVFAFKSGQINHVHAIIPDHYQNCVWILTGDFGDSACIWRALNGFKKVEPILCGKQIYRSCIAFPLKEGLLYATDSQLVVNSLRLLIKKGASWHSEFLSKINGPAIHGCQVNNYNIFSTSTEPNTEYNSCHMLRLIDTKPGPGILKNSSIVYAVDENMQIYKLYSKHKDHFPYRIFQFGTINFPSGVNTTGHLISYSVGNTQNDLSAEIRSLLNK